MRYRAFRLVATAQFTDTLMTIASDAFDIPADAHLATIAVALGVAVADLEAVESDTDPRGDPPYLALPVTPAMSRLESHRALYTQASTNTERIAVIRDFLELGPP